MNLYNKKPTKKEMSPLIPTPMNPRLYLSTSSTQKIAKWIPDAHVSFSLVWVNILKSIFLFKHCSQISLTLYEHIAFMEAVYTFTKYWQHRWIIREKSYKRLANNNNLAFKIDTMHLIQTYWQFYFKTQMNYIPFSSFDHFTLLVG